MNSKICAKCHELKLLSEFRSRKDRPGNQCHSYCKSCFREYKKEYRIKNKDKMNKQEKIRRGKKAKEEKRVYDKVYNEKYRYRGSAGLAKQLQMTSKQLIEIYDKLFDIQKGCCAICGVNSDKLGYRLSIDHNHKTLEIRALLCKSCNLGISNFNEDVNLLKSSIRYLTDRF